MISIVYGNEPYGIDVKKRKIEAMVTMPSMNLTFFTGEFGLDVLNTCNTFPFMEDKRGVFLEIDSLKALDNEHFRNYCQSPADFTELLIIVKDVDQRTKLYKSFKEQGLLTPCMKLKDMSELQKVIVYELKKRNATMDDAAASLFIKKMNYFNNDSVNLLNVVGYLDACSCISNTITAELVDKVCPSFEEANIFMLTSLIKDGDTTELYRQIKMIPSKDSIGIMSLLLKDFRVAYKLKSFSENEVSTWKTSFSSFSRELLCECMEILTSVISGVKRGTYTEDIALLTACSRIMSAINTDKKEGATAQKGI